MTKEEHEEHKRNSESRKPPSRSAPLPSLLFKNMRCSPIPNCVFGSEEYLKLLEEVIGEDDNDGDREG